MGRKFLIVLNIMYSTSKYLNLFSILALLQTHNSAIVASLITIFLFSGLYTFRSYFESIPLVTGIISSWIFIFSLVVSFKYPTYYIGLRVFEICN